MFNVARWRYLIYAAMSAFIIALKGFFYAHLLDEIQYASVNYYLLILGVGVLFVGAGVMVRCHTQLPLLVKNSSPSALVEFVTQVKWTGAFFWLPYCLVVVVIAQAARLSPALQVLSLLQVLVFFLFTVDLMVVKSRLEFDAYAKQLFVRNATIAVAGFCAAYVSSDANWTMGAEVGCALLICGRGLVSFVLSARLPSKAFFRASIAFVPVTLVGAVLQFVDRLLASSVLSAEQFSRFSYLSLIVLAGLSVQQLINTRIITVLPALCEEDPRAGFRYVLKASAAVGLVLIIALTLGMFALQSPWFAAPWFVPDYYLGLLFVLLALLRSVDFFTSYLLVLNQKLRLLIVQSTVVVLFGMGAALLKFYFAQAGVFEFVVMLLCGFFMMLLGLFLSAWRVSRVGKNF